MRKGSVTNNLAGGAADLDVTTNYALPGGERRSLGGPIHVIGHQDTPAVSIDHAYTTKTTYVATN